MVEAYSKCRPTCLIVANHIHRLTLKRNAIIAIGLISCILLLMWSPWITDAYAVDRVVEHLGDNDAKFRHLGEYLRVEDIPKTVVWYPFVIAVYFPSEAVWFVTFYGGII